MKNFLFLLTILIFAAALRTAAADGAESITADVEQQKQEFFKLTADLSAAGQEDPPAICRFRDRYRDLLSRVTKTHQQIQRQPESVSELTAARQSGTLQALSKLAEREGHSCLLE